MRIHPALPIALALALTSCKREPPPPPVEVAPVAEAQPPPPPPPQPVPMQATAITEEQERIELRQEGVTDELPAAIRLELYSPHALTDVRVRLFNPSDKLVPSDDELQVGQGTRYSLKPREPLEPATTYRLRIDAARGDKPTDVEGKTYEPRELTFRTRAENHDEEAGGSGG